MRDNQVEEVKSKVDIVSVIGEYIEVKKAGRNYKANCPFHGEKTPSFMISPELQIYKCFGCGASGDVFSFLERHEGMDFGESLRYLADRVGVKLVYKNDQKSDLREKIIEINKDALNFYQYVLLKHKIGQRPLKYLLEERGLQIEDINDFKIGYSPENSTELHKYLTTKKKHNDKDLVETGLFVPSKYRYYERFNGRIIFPLHDHKGNVVGFSGRLLPWDKRDTGKYINSPETAAYHKSKVLYGLNITKQFVREKEYVVVVEGEIDMISTYKAGIKNVVAIKGSVLTEDHIRLIGRFCKRIILCLDADFAGNEAAKRGAITASNMGFEVKVASIKDYKDPDEVARRDPEKFKEFLKGAISIWDFLVNTVFSKYDSGDGASKAKISQEISPLLALINDSIVRAHYEELVARKMSVPLEAVRNEVLKETSNTQRQDVGVEKFNGTKSRRQLLEESIIVNLVYEKEYLDRIDDMFDLFQSNITRKVVEYLKKNIGPDANIDVALVKENLPEELKAGFSEMVLENSEKNDLNILTKELKILDTKQKLEGLGREIREQEQSGDDTAVSKLQIKFTQLAKKLSALEEEK